MVGEEICRQPDFAPASSLVGSHKLTNRASVTCFVSSASGGVYRLCSLTKLRLLRYKQPEQRLFISLS